MLPKLSCALYWYSLILTLKFIDWVYTTGAICSLALPYLGLHHTTLLSNSHVVSFFVSTSFLLCFWGNLSNQLLVERLSRWFPRASICWWEPMGRAYFPSGIGNSAVSALISMWFKNPLLSLYILRTNSKIVPLDRFSEFLPKPIEIKVPFATKVFPKFPHTIVFRIHTAHPAQVFAFRTHGNQCEPHADALEENGQESPLQTNEFRCTTWPHFSGARYRITSPTFS